MRTRGIIGQRIVAIQQGQHPTSTGSRRVVGYIELEDGTRLFPIVHEPNLDRSDECSVSFVINTRNRHRK